MLRPLALVALALLACVPYAPAMLWGGFVWDDNSFLLQSERLREVSGIWTIWFEPGEKGKEDHYWPLTHTSFWLEHKLWGYDPTGYHVVNVLLHLANTLLVWHLMRRLSVPGAWLVAAVFAVHPLHVESVAWITERKDVLSGLFYLAAAATWMRFVGQPSRGRYAGALVLYVAALLSKSIAVTLPAALLILAWWKQGRVTAADLKRLVPFFAVGLVITLGDLSLSRSLHPVSFDYSFVERTLLASRALWFYVGKLVWPTQLAVIYPHWDIGITDRLYLIAAVALVMALWYFRPQLGRGPLAGALFFGVTISPVLGFVDYEYMHYSFVADRYQYLAGIGVMAFVIGSATQGVRRLSSTWQRAARSVAAVIIVALGGMTWQQAEIWTDDETLWRHVIKHNPEALSAYSNLSQALLRQGRYTDALGATRIAVEQYPNRFNHHFNLGIIFCTLERFVEAEPYLRRALALSQHDVDDAPDAHVALANCLIGLGRVEEALEHIDRALAIDPSHQKAQHNRAVVQAMRLPPAD